MNRANFKRFLYAGMMGVCAFVLCLVISDGVFGLKQPPAGSKAGIVIFWISLIALPLIFCKWTPWRYTLLNIPLYFLLYLSVYELFALKHTHLFLKTGGFMEFPPYWTALLVTAIFWGMQSLVYLLCKMVQSVWRRKPFSSK